MHVALLALLHLHPHHVWLHRFILEYQDEFLQNTLEAGRCSSFEPDCLEFIKVDCCTLINIPPNINTWGG